jgi:gliding motility-associated protein GldM
MGHGKETPRQKMIGIMYLFLTCMLALNVSKSVLDAFFIVNQGLTETTANFAQKNGVIYNAFDQAYSQNKEKVGPWKMKADSVKIEADKLVLRLQTLKDSIVRTADGLTPDVNEILDPVTGEMKKLEFMVSQKDNSSIPARIMYGQDNNGQAKLLKETIDSYRNLLLNMVPERSEGLRTALNKGLDTSEPPSKPGSPKISWESHNFEHMPLVAVLTIMSQLQAAVRNAEADVVTYLHNQIDAGSFKFNKLEPTIIPNSNYIMSGGDYSARIFLAASDTTAYPVVEIGKLDSTKNSDGTWSYSVRNPEIVPVDAKIGSAVLRRKTGSVGEQKYEGLVKIKAPGTEDTLTFPFRSSYLVAQPSLVVSPTSMNVFYIGVDNPVEISVPGVPSSEIRPSISVGSITKARGDGYNVKVTRPGNVKISVSAGGKAMGSRDFRVKRVPDPIAQVAGQRGGVINIPTLQAQREVFAVMDNFDFDLKFSVTSFTVSTRTREGFTVDAKSDNSRITADQRQLLSRLGRGQKVYFEDIKAKGPDGSIRDLGTITFTCQ